MKKNELKNWKNRILIFGLLLIVIFGAGCVRKVPSEQGETLVPLDDKPSAPMIVNLSMIGTPSLNQPVELIFTVMPLVDSPDTIVNIQLPAGISLVSGDLSWEGDISKNEIFQLKATVKSVETGYWTIESSARSMKFGFGKTDKLFINISETTAIVSETPIQIYSRSNETMVTQLPPNFTTQSVNETSDENILTPSPTLHTGKPSAPMIVNLSMIGTPSLNQPVELIFTVMPLVDSPDTIVNIQLPAGISLVSGDLSWEGDISKNEIFQLKATVKSVETGYWTIESSARSMKFGFGKTDKLYISLTDLFISVSDTPTVQLSNISKMVTTINSSEILNKELISIKSKTYINLIKTPLPTNPTEELKLRPLPLDLMD